MYNSTVETFEVILYDPVYFPQPNGNGMIKMQYKTFSNVDQGSASHYYPEHGDYCTIGLEDHTGLVGLQYTFNNDYPTAAHFLASQSAILFTSVPEDAPDTDIILAGMQLNGEAGTTVAHGEQATLGIQLQNIGVTTATGVHATLTCSSPQVTIAQAESDWADMDAMEMAWNSSNFEFSLSNWCPDQTPLPFTLAITTNQSSWNLSFLLTGIAPVYEVQQYVLEDADGNGWLSPGETASLDVWMVNSGHMDGQNLSAWLTSSQDWVDVYAGSASLSSLAVGEGGSLDTPFTFTIGDDAPYSAIFWLDLAVQDSSGIYILSQIEMNVGFRDDVEDGTGDWEHYAINGTDEWGQSMTRYSSPSHSWKFGGDDTYQGSELAALESPSIGVGPNAWLTFNHWMYAETSSNYPDYAFDGGYVQILWNDVWQSITPEGGYPYLSRGPSSPFDYGTPIYSGQFDWQRAWFDLSDYEGTVRFRFVFGADTGTQFEGWYIDDIAVTTQEGALLPPTNLLAANPGDDNVTLTWSAPATAPSAYNVYRRYSLDMPFELLATVTALSYCDSEPIAPMQYYVVTAAYDDLESCYSNSAQAPTSHGQKVSGTTTVACTALRGNFPNPFNPVTTVSFSLAAPDHAELAVYNIRGQRVRTLVNQTLAAGEHTVAWNGADDNGRACSTGVYFCCLRTGGKNITHKMLLLK